MPQPPPTTIWVGQVDYRCDGADPDRYFSEHHPGLVAGGMLPASLNDERAAVLSFVSRHHAENALDQMHNLEQGLTAKWLKSQQKPDSWFGVPTRTLFFPKLSRRASPDDIAAALDLAAPGVASIGLRIKRKDEPFGTHGFVTFDTRNDAKTALHGLQRMGIMCSFSRTAEDLQATGPPPANPNPRDGHRDDSVSHARSKQSSSSSSYMLPPPPPPVYDHERRGRRSAASSSSRAHENSSYHHYSSNASSYSPSPYPSSSSVYRLDSPPSVWTRPDDYMRDEYGYGPPVSAYERRGRMPYPSYHDSSSAPYHSMNSPSHNSMDSDRYPRPAWPPSSGSRLGRHERDDAYYGPSSDSASSYMPPVPPPVPREPRDWTTASSSRASNYTSSYSSTRWSSASTSSTYEHLHRPPSPPLPAWSDERTRRRSCSPPPPRKSPRTDRRREHEHEPSPTSSVPSRKWEPAAAGDDGSKSADRSTATKPEADRAKPTCVRSPSPLPANTAAGDGLNASSGPTLSIEVLPEVSPAVVPVETTPAIIVDSRTPSPAPNTPHAPVAAATAETTHLVMAPMVEGSSSEAPAPTVTATAALAETIETMDQMMVDGSPSPASTVMPAAARVPAAHAPTSWSLLAVPAVRTSPTPAPVSNSTLAPIGAPPAQAVNSSANGRTQLALHLKDANPADVLQTFTSRLERAESAAAQRPEPVWREAPAPFPLLAPRPGERDLGDIDTIQRDAEERGLTLIGVLQRRSGYGVPVSWHEKDGEWSIEARAQLQSAALKARSYADSVLKLDPKLVRVCVFSHVGTKDELVSQWTCDLYAPEFLPIRHAGTSYRDLCVLFDHHVFMGYLAHGGSFGGMKLKPTAELHYFVPDDEHPMMLPFSVTRITAAEAKLIHEGSPDSDLRPEATFVKRAREKALQPREARSQMFKEAAQGRAPGEGSMGNGRNAGTLGRMVRPRAPAEQPYDVDVDDDAGPIKPKRNFGPQIHEAKERTMIKQLLRGARSRDWVYPAIRGFAMSLGLGGFILKFHSKTPQSSRNLGIPIDKRDKRKYILSWKPGQDLVLYPAAGLQGITIHPSDLCCLVIPDSCKTESFAEWYKRIEAIINDPILAASIAGDGDSGDDSGVEGQPKSSGKSSAASKAASLAKGQTTSKAAPQAASKVSSSSASSTSTESKGKQRKSSKSKPIPKRPTVIMSDDE